MIIDIIIGLMIYVFIVTPIFELHERIKKLEDKDK